MDNLNYYSAWLPAGQQTDRYSSQPWCLRSKNLDIFSSSKSVKATAWSEPTTADSDVIKQDWNLVLKTDWKVYTRSWGTDTLLVDPSVNFPVYKVSYNWSNGTYADAQRWTPQDLVTKYEGDTLKSYVVYTDRASYTYSSVKYVLDKKIWTTNLTATHDWERAMDYSHTGFRYSQSASQNSSSITITIDDAPFAKIPVWLFAHQNNNSDTNISIDYIRHKVYKYYYDAQLDWMTPASLITNEDISYTWTLTDWFYVDLPINPTYWTRNVYEISFKYTKKEGASTFGWSWDLCIDYNLPNDPSENSSISAWDYNDYYSYLPVRERKLISVWDYGYSESFWMKGTSFQPLYKWVSSWRDVNGEKKTIYDFITDMGWESDVSMDVIWMIIWNEQVYMIGNLDWDWYIIPCDLTWGRWTPYIAYGCEFKWVVNIDYLMYLVWEDRGVSQLWVYNGQELVGILWGTEEKDTKNLINNIEQYKFDWKMIEYRDVLILSTLDNRIFAYWQTYGGKGWAFIHQLPWPITNISANSKDLVVDFSYPTVRQVDTYSGDAPYGDADFGVKVYAENWSSILYNYNHIWHSTTAWAILTRLNTYTGGNYTWLSLTLDWHKLASDYPLAWTSDNPVVVYIVWDLVYTKKVTSLQDDTPIRNYNTEWMAEYPIVLWDHLLEKEESDLFVSYILPSATSSLEFWGMANHYHFWTFTSSDTYTFSTTTSYKMKGCTGNYVLKYIETNGNQYTFRLEWDLPVQTTNDMKITDTEWTELITYSDFNHFRKIWEITTAEYQEWKFRFHNLNNKLELPKSYSLQIMVKGKGTVNYTPELFALDLVANQRDRW